MIAGFITIQFARCLRKQNVMLLLMYCSVSTFTVHGEVRIFSNRTLYLSTYLFRQVLTKLSSSDAKRLFSHTRSQRWSFTNHTIMSLWAIVDIKSWYIFVNHLFYQKSIFNRLYILGTNLLCFSTNTKINYMLNSLANILMSKGNSINKIDLFHLLSTKN